MDASTIHAYTETEEQAAKLVDALLDAERWVDLMGYVKTQQEVFLQRFGVPDKRWCGEDKPVVRIKRKEWNNE